MKLSSGKRMGQSGQELASAVFFSSFLHVLFLLTGFFLYMIVFPRVHVPLFYEVKLVGLPAETPPLPQTPPSGAPLPAPEKQVKPEPKPKGKAVEKERHSATKKDALPDLNAPKQKPAIPEQARPAEKPHERQGAPAGSTTPGVKTESVAVATPSQDFKFSWYLERVRDKIGQNWNPPPDAKDAKARVIFSINRSGWLGEVNLNNENSNGTFGFKQAAIRAIRASNPFPPLPEEFAKQTLEFSVDLTAE